MYETLEVPRHRNLPPSSFFATAELMRTWMEALSLGSSWPLLSCAPRGDGHGVMVLPGFAASDTSTTILRRYLARLGYAPVGWELGTNTGSEDIQQRLVRRFLRVARSFDGPISLVGQSLGGIFARELARRFPHLVRLVISLGSPFGTVNHGTTNPLVQALFERMSGGTVNQMRAALMTQDPKAPPPVPSTAIYSKSDGVVAWHTCLERPSDTTENIEIIASHSGMAVNPLVFHAVADRLPHTRETWRPFDRSVGLRAMLYPAPEAAHD